MNKLTKIGKLRVGIILVTLALMGVGILTVAQRFTSSTEDVDSLAEERINKPVTDTTVQTEPEKESDLEPIQESITEPIQESVIIPEQELVTESSVLESITE